MIDAESLPIEPLDSSHDRGVFNCGLAKIDNFLRINARRQNDAYQVRVFVVCEPGTRKVIGFYSLTLTTFVPDSVSEEAKEKFSRWSAVPTIYLAMIGVSSEFQGHGLGYRLMQDAFDRSLSVAEHVGTYAIALHAVDEKVAQQYERYGYIRFIEGELAMFLPLKTLRQAKAQADAASAPETAPAAQMA